MKLYRNIFVASLLLLLLGGCATRSAIVPAQDGNVVIFTDTKSGKVITVTVGESYAFKRAVDREFKGVPVQGYLYANEGESGVLVAKLSRSDFEELAGVNLGKPESGVKLYPASTLYQSQYCELVRAYVAAIGSDVVAAVKVKSLDAETTGCGDWLSLADVMVDDLALVEEFDRTADQAISIRTN